MTLSSAVRGAQEALGSTGDVQRAADTGTPRFELFHAANSICSQKVRTVLAHHGQAYASHTVKLFLGQTYLPAYVRLRMIGCQQFGGALVSHHSGSTSAIAGGCDGAVVPTLVDWQTEQVIVDSRRICVHLDEQLPEASRLRPLESAAAIDEQLAIVDNLPNYQMLMGRKPGASESEATKDKTGGNFSQKKVAWCDQYLQEAGDEPGLVAAYTAKRAKELSAANTLFSPQAMDLAYGKVDSALKNLEIMLAHRDGAWLFGHGLSMADLFWGIELLRLANMGVGIYGEDAKLPHVARFVAAIEALPSIREAIIDWPGALF